MPKVCSGGGVDGCYMSLLDATCGLCNGTVCVWLTALLISLLHLNRLNGYVGEYYYLKTVAFMVYHNFLLNVWPAGVATSRSSWQTHVLSMLRLMLSSKHINHSQLLIT